MKLFHRMIAVSVLPLLASLLAFPAQAETGFDANSASRINAANDLVRTGKYDQALASYGEVNPTPADRAELDYNRAVAHYRSGDIDSARSAFELVSTSTSGPLAAAARYNLGNCFYTDATHVVEQEPAAAIDALQQAIDHYRGALASDPNLVDARANIELASEWIKRLQQQNQADKDQRAGQDQPPDNKQPDKEQPPSQDQQADKEQQSDKDQQPGGKQQSDKDQQPGDASKETSEAEQSQSKQDQQPGTQSQPGDAPDDQTSPTKPSPKQSASDESQADTGPQDKLNRGATTPGDDQQGSGAEPELDAQRPAKQQPAEQQPAEQAPAPNGELTPAGQPDDDQQLPAAGAMGDANANATPMTKVEALKMLQAVRDRDMLRRLRQQQNQRNQHVPTDRDW